MPDQHPMVRAKFLLLTGLAMEEMLLHPEQAFAHEPGETIDIPPSPLHGVVAVGIHVQPQKGVLRVELFVDGKLLGADATLPYAFVWDTTKVSDGSHVLRADAVYRNRRHQAQETVVVDNVNGTAVVFPSLTLYPCEARP